MQSTDLPRWEYRILEASGGLVKSPDAAPSGRPVAAVMNELGAEGWELVAVLSEPEGQSLYFKRPQPQRARKQLSATPYPQLPPLGPDPPAAS